jgi:predicted nucleic acid-binding protein
LKTVTFVDSSLLIAAARGNQKESLDALAVLDDPDRAFASSVFVQLEVLPKAVFFRKTTEEEFYQAFFRKVRRWAPAGKVLAEEALRVATRAGLSAIDALHVAAAMAVGADELVTAEKPTKPLHRVSGISVRSIHPGERHDAIETPN